MANCGNLNFVVIKKWKILLEEWCRYFNKNHSDSVLHRFMRSLYDLEEVIVLVVEDRRICN
jgi:hypothetical protein